MTRGLKGTRRAGMTTRRAKKTVKITKTVKVPKMKDTMKAQVLSTVRRLLSRDAENKAVGWNVETCVSHNSAISSADCYPLVQQIVSGTSAQQRIGDKLKPKSLTVRGVLALANEDLNTSQDIYVRVVIASQKNIKVGSAINGGVDAGRLLRPAIAGSDMVPFNGNTQELTYPINKELFRVYMDRVFKLTSVAADTGLAGHGSVEANAGYSRRWQYQFKDLPASFSYDDGNGDWANNFAPFIAIGYAFSDCTEPDLVTTRIKSNTFSLLEYEDA